MMHPILNILLGNTAVALTLSAVAMPALLLKRPALAHALWLLVLIKLITPPLVHVPVEMPKNVAPIASTIASETTSSIHFSGRLEAPVEAVTEALPAAEPTLAEIHTATNKSWPIASILLSGWLLGSLTCAGLVAIRIVRFGRLLCTGAPAEEGLVERVAQLARRVGLRRPPDVRVVAAAVSPMVYCLFRRPVLVLPGSLIGRLPGDGRDAILAHELAHVKRRDHWVRWIEVAATVALWWHPLLWLARRGLREAEEQCCDAWAVSVLPDAERRTYADTLVDAAGIFSSPDDLRLPPLASGLGEFKQLKRRIVMIMKHQPRRNLSPVARVFVLALLLAVPVVPALAQETPAAQEEELKQLRQRVQQLEERLAKAEAELAASKASAAGAQKATAEVQAATAAQQQNEAAATREQIDAQRAKARARSRQDAQKYTPEQLAEAEQLYQVANKDWRSPEAIVSLKQMIEKYPDVNRTGCAVLYLGQMSQGDTREEYLKRAVENHSDCYYFNGVQVGGYGRYLLAAYYQELGKQDEAKKLLEELVSKYPDALTHRQQRLLPTVRKALATLRGHAQPTQPAQ